MINSNKTGYALATFMFVIAFALGVTSWSADNIISQLFILFVMGLLIIAGVFMLKEIGGLEKRNDSKTGSNKN